MPFKKGQTGNPNGRPKVADSLAVQIRTSGTPERREKMLARMWDIASEPHADVRARVAACEWIAKHGWPEEAKGVTTVTTEGGKTIVRHEHVNA